MEFHATRHQMGPCIDQTGRNADGFRRWTAGERRHTCGRIQGQQQGDTRQDQRKTVRTEATNLENHSRKATWTQNNLNKGVRDPVSEELLRNIFFYCSWISSSSKSCSKKMWNVQKHPIYAAHKQNTWNRIDFKGHSRAEENQLSSGKKARAHILQTFKYQLRIIILSDFFSPLGAFRWSANNMQ